MTMEKSVIDNRQSSIALWDLWAEHYDREPNPLLALEERVLCQLLPDLSGLRVADIACGTGRWMTQAWSQRAQSVVGLDFSPAMLRQAAGHIRLYGHLVRADARQVPFASESFDVVFCSFALGYFPDLGTVANELARILKPAGQLFCSDFHPGAHRYGWKRSFKQDDTERELENAPHSAEDVLTAFASRFELRRQLEPAIGESERIVFSRAGRLDLFKRVRGLPAVILLHWVRRP